MRDGLTAMRSIVDEAMLELWNPQDYLVSTTARWGRAAAAGAQAIHTLLVPPECLGRGGVSMVKGR